MANTLLDFVSDLAYNVDLDSPRSLAISIYHRFAVVVVWGSLVMVEMVFVKLQDKHHHCRHPTMSMYCFAGFLSSPSISLGWLPPLQVSTSSKKGVVMTCC
jgi:hypothetical protein